MRFDIAIIGCGASGAVLATQCFRQASRALSVCCIDPSPRLGAGLAYGACGEQHLLNVPAARISAIAGQDFDFVDWLRQRDRLTGDPAGLFAPRRWYADYLTDCIGRALRNAQHRHIIDHRAARAVDLAPDAGGWRIRLASGEVVEARAAVMALGNLRDPRPPAGLEALADDARYLHDPWRIVTRRMRRDRPVAIIGSGLTAVDIVQTLIDGGHRASIDVVSRSGQWPSVHAERRESYAVQWPEGSLKRLLGELHRHLEAVEADGGDWRDVIDSLRPHSQRLWQALGERDKRRFRRRLTGVWGRVRHRMPPEIGRALARWQREGRIRTHAAPELRAVAGERELELWPHRRAAPLKVARVINATGPLADLRRADDVLLAGLFADGRVRPGALGVGLDADADGRLIDRGGRAWDRLRAIGPMLQGNLLESTAMPEIKVQAFRLAGDLLATLADVDDAVETAS